MRRSLQPVFSFWLSVLPRVISKIDAARITQLDIQMFNNESWKSNSKVKVTRHKKSVGLQTKCNIAACCVRKALFAGFKGNSLGGSSIVRLYR